MDVKLINPVLETMVTVMSTMANLTPSIGKPSLKNDQTALGEVTGIMRMNSGKVRASMAITFTRPAMLTIIKRMLGEELTELDDTARDMAGEMTNMVVGGAKNLYAEQGYDFDMTTPSILMGDKHQVCHEISGKTIVLPFNAEGNAFFVELCFED